jgi:hypothetical protein
MIAYYSILGVSIYLAFCAFKNIFKTKIFILFWRKHLLDENLAREKRLRIWRILNSLPE